MNVNEPVALPGAGGATRAMPMRCGAMGTDNAPRVPALTTRPTPSCSDPTPSLIRRRLLALGRARLPRQRARVSCDCGRRWRSRCHDVSVRASAATAAVAGAVGSEEAGLALAHAEDALATPTATAWARDLELARLPRRPLPI